MSHEDTPIRYILDGGLPVPERQPPMRPTPEPDPVYECLGGPWSGVPVTLPKGRMRTRVNMDGQEGDYVVEGDTLVWCGGA